MRCVDVSSIDIDILWMFWYQDFVQKVLINDGLAKFLLCWRLEKPKFLAVDQGVHLAATFWELSALSVRKVQGFCRGMLKMMTNGFLFLYRQRIEEILRSPLRLRDNVAGLNVAVAGIKRYQKIPNQRDLPKDESKGREGPPRNGRNGRNGQSASQTYTVFQSISQPRHFP